MISEMKHWFGAALLGVMLVSIPVCPAMAFGDASSHDASMASEMHSTEHVNLPAPSCCLGVPAHPSEQGVVVDSVSVTASVIAIAPATIPNTIGRAPVRRHDVRIRAPDKKFECRTKAKRE